MRLLIAMVLCLSMLCGPALAAGSPVDVRDMMTANQFHATGLDKLTPEQLAAFDTWLAGYSYPAIADKAPDVRNLVSADQFHALGFDQLTPEELTAFNGWLTAYRPAAAVAGVVAVAPAAPTPAPSAVSNAKFGEEMLPNAERGEPDIIESRIVGTFNGWNGRTVIHLENGQVWQQADSSSFDITLQNPKVIIKSLTLGYVLSIPGHGAAGSVFVRRIH